MNNEMESHLQRKERLERAEHQDALLAIASLIGTKQGYNLFKYLFKTLSVGELPPPEMQGIMREEYLGFLRAGNSIYKLASEAASEMTATIMAKIEREKYDNLREEYRIESEYTPGE